MDFDKHTRATLTAYYLAHKCWKGIPPQHKTDKAIAKEMRDAAHSKLMAVAKMVCERQQEAER